MTNWIFRGTTVAVAALALLGAWDGTAWAQDDATDTSRGAVLDEITVQPAGAADRPLVRRGGVGGACCPVPEGCCPTTCLESPLFKLPCIDDCIGTYQLGKLKSCLRVTAGAYHWWNYNLDDEEWRYGYQIPGVISLPGTYFYFLLADLKCEPCGCIEYGAHVHARFREQGTSRPWIDESAWFQEAYAYAKAPAWGTLKAGKINYKFGLGLRGDYGEDTHWDDTFWGNVPYFNGVKFNSEWGFSWEHSVDWKRLTMPFSVQLFFGEDEYNGSFAGGDAESSAIYDQDITGVVRIQPTWHIDTKTNIRLGLSALAGSVSNAAGADETRTGFAADLTFTWCDFTAWAEYSRIDGITHETHYVTGGPTDTREFWLFGARYQLGPFKPRIHYSRGDYTNPGGEEAILNVGLDIKLTNWITLMLEYVDWTLQPTGGAEVQVEDGVQIVLLWVI